MDSLNVVADDFTHGDNFKIGSFSIIHKDVVVGNNVEIGNYTVIMPGARIGDNTVIGNYCEIGASLQTGKNVIIQGRIRMADHCTIEDDVTIKYGTILTSHVLLKKNCFLGPNVITLGSTHKRVTKHGTIIGENTYIGGGSIIAGATEVGDNITVGAQGFVNKSILESGIYVGLPVKKIK